MPERSLPVGLIDKLARTRRVRNVPEPVPTPGDPKAIAAPVSGRVIALEEVPDDAFSQGMLGRGVGIKGDGTIAFSPVTGTVVADVKTRHALLIRAENGAEVLLHVGLDSVRLGGAGFALFVEKGDHVKAGDPLISFDRRLMSERGLDDTVVVTLTNPEKFEHVEPVGAGSEVSAGSVVLRAE